MKKKLDKEQLHKLIEMIGNMARLDFSNRIETEMTNDPIDLMAYGLNMLSEELESNVVKKSLLEEINNNLERFAYTAAHDMKSPLNTASGLISLIEHELKKSENNKIREYLLLLKETNERAKSIINVVLEYSRLNFSNLNMQEIDLGKLCSELTKEYALQKEVVILIGENMPIVVHNETALAQIISNLLNNAVKFNDKEICHVEIQCTVNEDEYEIAIIDNGPGIKKEDRERIFILFETLNDKKDNSTGIGLAIVHKIVTETKGTIKIESTDMGGSKFIFTIPKERKLSPKI